MTKRNFFQRFQICIFSLAEKEGVFFLLSKKAVKTIDFYRTHFLLVYFVWSPWKKESK